MDTAVASMIARYPISYIVPAVHEPAKQVGAKPVRAEPCTDVLNTVVAGVKCGIASRARSYHREVIPLKVMNQPAACLDSLVSVSALRQRLQKLSQIY